MSFQFYIRVCTLHYLQGVGKGAGPSSRGPVFGLEPRGSGGLQLEPHGSGVYTGAMWAEREGSKPEPRAGIQTGARGPGETKGNLLPHSVLSVHAVCAEETHTTV